MLLFLLAGSQAVSNYMMSALEILLGVNWLLECDYRRKFSTIRHKDYLALFLAFMLLIAVHLLWMLPTENVSCGWNDLFKKLPLFAVPVIVLLSIPLNRKQLEFIFLFFITTVLVACIIGYVRYYRFPDLPYRDIVPYISHIRFSLNVCLAIVLIVWFLTMRSRKETFYRDWLWWMAFVELFVIMGILLKMRSFTAFIALFVTAVVMLIAFWKRIASRRNRIILLTAFLLLVAVIISVSVSMARQYFSPVPLVKQPLAEYTAAGNPYTHTSDGMIENGNLIGNYLCEKELREQWPTMSQMDIDAITPDGYSVLPTLVRYLNGLGTTKDSVGMQLLTPQDVAAIENGIANPVYIYGSTLKQMYFVIFFEYENYRLHGCVRDFTMLERIELWRNAWRVFLKKPLFGVGTGDVFDATSRQLEADNSPIFDTHKHVHNQYLSFLVAFGALGTLLVFAAFGYAFRRLRLLKLAPVAAYVSICLVSFLSEDTLETLAGCLFCVLFLCLFAIYRTSDDTQNSL